MASETPNILAGNHGIIRTPAVAWGPKQSNSRRLAAVMSSEGILDGHGKSFVVYPTPSK